MANPAVYLPSLLPSFLPSSSFPSLADAAVGRLSRLKRFSLLLLLLPLYATAERGCHLIGLWMRGLCCLRARAIIYYLATPSTDAATSGTNGGGGGRLPAAAPLPSFEADFSLL